MLDQQIDVLRSISIDAGNGGRQWVAPTTLEPWGGSASTTVSRNRKVVTFYSYFRFVFIGEKAKGYI